MFLKFAYFKWLLNNLNHIEKLSIHLQSPDYLKTDEIIWNSIIDASFISKYCLPDEIIHLKQFHFYIVSQYESIKKTSDEIIYSFQIHPAFLNYQWTNIKCLFDPILSNQYLFSSSCSCSIYKRKFTHNFIHVPKSVNHSNIRCIWIDIDSNLHSFLRQFNQLFPNVFCIKVNLEYYTRFDISTMNSLITSFEIDKSRSLSNIQLHNVTRLDFSPDLSRRSGSDEIIERNKIRATLLAHLISMPVQLKCLRIQEFEWLIHMIQYASDILRRNALSSVEYVEFFIPSCNLGSTEDIHIGKNLVPFLSIYMPYLRTLRLWRSDDFPWTSISMYNNLELYIYISYRQNLNQNEAVVRPIYTPRIVFSQTMMLRWCKSLQTSDSINQHVFVFQHDLNELFEQLNKLVFLEILGEIHEEKVEPYRSMVQRNFPNSQYHIDISRFRLWI
ncbi:hypothetical protein I4U23_027086 [Adineta vaga]|nr:hypothetical protein I4U23_027086 [Adineta vaga]